MQIVVASSNIFRRELSSYILSEAGYTIGEARNVEALLSMLRAGSPQLLIIDSQIDGAEPAHVLRALRHLTAAPILWLAEPGRARPLLMVDSRPGDFITWPYRSDELTHTVAGLLGRSVTALSEAQTPEHFAGSAE